jgi:hypothetical protein
VSCGVRVQLGWRDTWSGHVVGPHPETVVQVGGHWTCTATTVHTVHTQLRAQQCGVRQQQRRVHRRTEGAHVGGGGPWGSKSVEKEMETTVRTEGAAAGDARRSGGAHTLVTTIPTAVIASLCVRECKPVGSVWSMSVQATGGAARGAVELGSSVSTLGSVSKRISVPTSSSGTYDSVNREGCLVSSWACGLEVAWVCGAAKPTHGMLAFLTPMLTSQAFLQPWMWQHVEGIMSSQDSRAHPCALWICSGSRGLRCFPFFWPVVLPSDCGRLGCDTTHNE